MNFKEGELHRIAIYGTCSRPLIAFSGKNKSKGGKYLNKRLNPLTENHLFSKAYKNGVCDVNKLCAVYVLKNIRKNKDGTPMKTKLGIAVNAKLGGAVERNRVKRIIREAYSVHLPNISDGLLIVIAARGAAFSHSAKSTGISKCLENSFNNLGAFKGQVLKAKSSGINKKQNNQK